jgi:hypothetical protein
MQRETEAKARPYPARKGPTVYHWVKVRGYWLRKIVWPKKYEALWRDTREHHRVYNSIRNEWDVSHLLGPDESVVDDSYEGWDIWTPDCDEDDDDPDTETSAFEIGMIMKTNIVTRDQVFSTSPSSRGSTSTTIRRSSPAPHLRTNDTDGEASLILSTKGVARLMGEDDIYDGVVLELEDVLRVLESRHGFAVKLPYFSTERTDGHKKLDVKAVMRILAHMTFARFFDGPELLAIRDFVDSLTNNSAAHSPGRLLTDLTPTNIRHHALQTEALLVIRPVTNAQQQTAYILLSSDKFQPEAGNTWKLVVTSATTALEVARRKWGPEKEEIAQELVQRGIPFFTLVPSALPCSVDEDSAVIPQHGWQGLGFREPKYQPTILDYVVYDVTRRVVLSRPHARSALMRGGIVWRLAYEDVDPGRVLFGPSESSRKLVQSLGDIAHEDDSLSEEELYCICGVYRVYQGIWFFHALEPLTHIPSQILHKHPPPRARGGQKTRHGETAA